MAIKDLYQRVKHNASALKEKFNDASRFAYVHGNNAMGRVTDTVENAVEQSQAMLYQSTQTMMEGIANHKRKILYSAIGLQIFSIACQQSPEQVQNIMDLIDFNVNINQTGEFQGMPIYHGEIEAYLPIEGSDARIPLAFFDDLTTRMFNDNAEILSRDDTLIKIQGMASEPSGVVKGLTTNAINEWAEIGGDQYIDRFTVYPQADTTGIIDVVKDSTDQVEHVNVNQELLETLLREGQKAYEEEMKKFLQPDPEPHNPLPAPSPQNPDLKRV
ncbi:MAG: hypothetical protein ABIC95_03685 [archaeon]